MHFKRFLDIKGTDTNHYIVFKDNKIIYEHPKVLAFQLFSKIGRPLTVQQDGPSRHFAVALTTSDSEEINEIISYIKKDCILHKI